MNNQTNGKAIASLVLSIIAFILVFSGPFAIIGIILSIVGLVTGIKANKVEKSGMATAGIIISIISLVLCAIMFVAFIGCVALIGSAL
ncbi:MAG: DUF4190 domain-containing protein [Bacillota bacterium]|jgi:hypothetical protein